MIVTLKVDQAEVVRWRTSAIAADLTLSAWIRMRCSEVQTPKEVMQATAINESNKQYYHAATSNRHTCLCPSCTEYRRLNDIPLGGFK